MKTLQTVRVSLIAFATFNFIVVVIGYDYRRPELTHKHTFDFFLEDDPHNEAFHGKFSDNSDEMFPYFPPPHLLENGFFPHNDAVVDTDSAIDSGVENNRWHEAEQHEGLISYLRGTNDPAHIYQPKFKRLERPTEPNYKPFVFPTGKPPQEDQSRRIKWPTDLNSIGIDAKSNLVPNSQTKIPIAFPTEWPMRSTSDELLITDSTEKSFVSNNGTENNALADIIHQIFPPNNNSINLIELNQNNNATDAHLSFINQTDAAKHELELEPLLYIDSNGLFQIKYTHSENTTNIGTIDEFLNESINKANETETVFNENEEFHLDIRRIDVPNYNNTDMNMVMESDNNNDFRNTSNNIYTNESLPNNNTNIKSIKPQQQRQPRLMNGIAVFL